MCITEVSSSDIGRNTGYTDLSYFLDFCVCTSRSRDSALNQATTVCFLCYSVKFDVQMTVHRDKFL